SNEMVVWAGVTMVDAQALVFSALAFYCALRVYRTGAWGWALGAGAAWGMAYFVRHTQLVIVVGLLALILNALFSRRVRLRNLILLATATFIVALPDLWYHQMYLGNWLRPESEELALFSLSAIPTTLLATGQSAFAAFEFGWLVLFIVIGIVLHTRRAPITSVSLLLWFSATLAIQLPYAALRLRDLLPEFPIFAFYSSYGTAASIALLWQKNRAWAAVLAAALLFLSLEFSLLRVWNTLPRVFQPAPKRFGAMTQIQRMSFNQLAQLTLPNAVIGASLNSGAIDLYVQRETFRPAEWNASQLREFITPLLADQRTVYLLEDDSSLTRVLNDLGAAYPIERIATLDVPLFGDQAIGNPGALWKLNRP
ncbi:MAG TPA: glycosyltransferase family 39 protein, partial [Anaerolineae bacterium]|nr:glycosyltransferase family 39 protein [Anaerolineae bacterium]